MTTEHVLNRQQPAGEDARRRLLPGIPVTERRLRLAGIAIAARFAVDHGAWLSRLVLVDALGLAQFEPAPEFGRALNAFLAQPSERTHDGLWRHCALDLDGLLERIGAQWEPFRAYNLDRAGTPSVMSALGSLMAQFGAPAIPPEDLARITVPTALIWGRHDLATRLAVAEAASARHGWPLHVIDDAADDPAIEQPDAFLRALRDALGTARTSAPDAGALAARGFSGEIVGRGHARYDELRRVFNGMIDRHPALIARCTDAQDVSTAVDFARNGGLPVSIYSGGHNVTGNAVCDDAEVMCGFHLSKPSPLTQILMLPGGGAGARVPDGTMAICERGAPFNIHITSLWADPEGDHANIAWTRQLSAAMKPFTTGRVYVNFIGDEGEDRVIASFGSEAYPRLQALKARYDPGNLFSSNQNIKPGGAVMR